jgi:hypothetical protein
LPSASAIADAGSAGNIGVSCAIAYITRHALRMAPSRAPRAASTMRLAQVSVTQEWRGCSACLDRIGARLRLFGACLRTPIAGLLACHAHAGAFAVACGSCLARGGTSIFCFFAGGPSEQSFARRRSSRSALTPVLGKPCFAQSSLSCATVRPPSSGGAAPCTRPHNDAPARASDALGCNARASACSGADAHGSESASTDAPVLVRVP